ncbi:hypothetical protein [Phyllobacterium sp. P30BS-XVII]|uniref:hypothetical protein n=1 Tax=Phyllobacterium sp. P30BS-XVII TaxID=2587046 RepID=UPI0015FB19E8|nr:hypothetical protein [Phyllobacterium sp. P30BS-XVII]MBA8904122.1 hypothetical protein [Phyllobacterium sp. P30BS-XVII]
MAVMTKIVIYGGTGSGKYVLALQLKRDNPVLGEPILLKSPSEVRPFLQSPHSGIGIIHALSVAHIMTKSHEMEFGPVLFVPAPKEVEQWGDELANDAAAWDWLMGINTASNTDLDKEAAQLAAASVPAQSSTN